MATKGVLGNDPFLRGAAARSPDAPATADGATAAAPSAPPAKPARKPGPPKAAAKTAAQKPAAAKSAAVKSAAAKTAAKSEAAKEAAPRTTAVKAPAAKALAGKAPRATGAGGASTGKAPRKTRALPVADAFETPPPEGTTGEVDLAATGSEALSGDRAAAGPGSRTGDVTPSTPGSPALAPSATRAADTFDAATPVDAEARDPWALHEGAAHAAVAHDAAPAAPAGMDEEPSLDRAFGGRRRATHDDAADTARPTAADAVRDVSEAAARSAQGPGSDWGLGQAVAVTGGLASRALSLLGAARELAQGALAGEGLGRALSAAQGLADAVRTGLGVGGAGALDAYGKDATLVDELRPVLDFLYGRYWRVETEGAEHVPSGPCILVANHSGAVPYDGLVLHLALARARPELPESRWLLEDQVFHAPVVGTLFNRLGAVRASPENALRLLDEGRPVLVFPEGFQGLSKPFAQRYQLKRFGRGGFVKLALRARVPVVPVSVIGGEESSPLLARLPGEALGLPYVPVSPLGPLPLPAKWRVRFGAPLDLGGAGPEVADDLARVGELTERTREAIQGMLESLLRERRSVFRG